MNGIRVASQTAWVAAVGRRVKQGQEKPSFVSYDVFPYRVGLGIFLTICNVYYVK